MAMTLVALVLVAALNPLVVRSPEPHGNVPGDCEVSDTPAMPRAAAADPAVEDPAVPLPPVRPAARATAQTRAQYDVRPLQSAIAANNRAQFDAELARAREAGAPTRVYEDVGRLWDAQFEAPFFAEGSEPHRIASQYPGYEAAVREQIFTDASGRKFYPASESKAFVARQTGVNLPARTTTQRSSTSTPTTTRSTPQQPSNPATQQPTTTRTTTRQATRQPATRTTHQPPPPNPRTPAPQKPSTPAARRDPAPSRRSPDPSVAQKPAATVPAPVVPPVENTSSTSAPPATGSLPDEPLATTTTSDPFATDTTATDTVTTDTMVTDTATTAPETATTTTTATTTDGTATPRGRSIILPAILILIGLGVLILLFKAR
jgi:hypothetical protein